MDGLDGAEMLKKHNSALSTTTNFAVKLFQMVRDEDDSIIQFVPGACGGGPFFFPTSFDLSPLSVPLLRVTIIVRELE